MMRMIGWTGVAGIDFSLGSGVRVLRTTATGTV